MQEENIEGTVQKFFLLVLNVFEKILSQGCKKSGSCNLGLIHVFEVVNIRRGPKNGLTPECEAYKVSR